MTSQREKYAPGDSVQGPISVHPKRIEIQKS